MTKSRRRKRVSQKASSFYEALAAAPRLPRALLTAATAVGSPNLEATNPANPHATGVPWRQLAADAAALTHDVGMYAGHAWRRLAPPRVRKLWLTFLVTGAVAGTSVAGVLAVQTLQKYGPELSNPAIIMNQKDVGTTILDRNGVVLFQGYGAEDRQTIPLSDVPASVKNATLAAEDPNFYTDPGFSVKGTTRAAYQDILHSGKLQGGSTITQQLVKDTLLNNEKSFTRKYQEIVLSVDMDHRYSKDQILQMYFNTIYYGEGAYGIESAAQTYFHKPAKDLTLEEGAVLSGLPQSPSIYDPNVDPNAALVRRDYVLDRMQQLGYASPAAVTQAKAQAINANSRNVEIKAPHFVFYVLDQLRQQYGENEIEHGGITVRTTLDYAKQQAAQTIVTAQVTKLASHHVSNGGLVSLDPHNGDILAMVGSIDYNQPGYGAVNVTLAQLQPGSSFKPIAYAVAFLKGWNGATTVQDAPVSFPEPGGPAYTPQDYDLKFRGPVLLRRALANSLNIPAIHVLQFATINATIAMAHTLGIQSPSLTDPNGYGLSLVLGGGDVRPLDMAAVYATFANGGKQVIPRAILSVDDKFGTDITKPQPHPAAQPVLDPRVAYMLTNILSDDKARQEEFGVNNPLQLSRVAAAKTGTTNDFRDNWTIGYTPDIATAVWVGNNDHSAMQGIDGITGAAPIWHDYMETALAGTPVHDFTVPPGVIFAKVCASDGGLAVANDPAAINEVFLAGTVPTKPCGSYGGHPTVTITPPIQPTLPAQPVPLAQAPAAPTPTPETPSEPGVGGGKNPSPTPTPKGP